MRTNFWAADRACKECGGKLAEPQNANEDMWLANYFRKHKHRLLRSLNENGNL